MPNHITNVLDVTGPKKDVQAFKKKIFSYEKDEHGKKVPVFDFETTVPMPKELDIESGSNEKMKPIYEENMKKFGYKTWYEWHCAKWGTKWNAYSVDKPEAIDGGIRFKFDTAWSPPTQWLVTTALLFPSLELKDTWKDEGGGAAIYILHGEETVKQDMTDDEWLMTFDEGYKEEFLFITEGPYQEVLDKHIKDNEVAYYGMDRHLINRLKDIDLPRFINFEWSSYAKETYEERLKNAKKE